jgi:hypothetical protein
VSYSRKFALATGMFFVITIIASIPPVLFLYAPVLGDPRWHPPGPSRASRLHRTSRVSLPTSRRTVPIVSSRDRITARSSPTSITPNKRAKRSLR